ncbi:MAG: hypothetical protein HZB59_03890 [Ignavibacteriales bacterium]|nr:hypothetical protein [Ignavibacteriales bacterium]
METNKFKFNFYRFTGTQDNRTTEITRDISTADGMRGLVDMKADQIKLATQRATDWASSNHLTINPKPPFPSTKYPGKAWLEFRFTGLAL